MSMKQIMSITLNAAQVREACEAYVERRIDPKSEQASAKIDAKLAIVVTVSRRRVRPARTKANGDAQQMPAHEGPRPTERLIP